MSLLTDAKKCAELDWLFDETAAGKHKGETMLAPARGVGVWNETKRKNIKYV
jgi:hypothetical protein